MIPLSNWLKIMRLPKHIQHDLIAAVEIANHTIMADGGLPSGGISQNEIDILLFKIMKSRARDRMFQRKHLGKNNTELK